MPSLANEVGMSRSGSFDRFRALVGEPPGRYLTRWRMTLAPRALGSEDVELRELADRLGYATEASFSRAFRRHHGRTPGTFRREQRAGRRRAGNCHGARRVSTDVTDEPTLDDATLDDALRAQKIVQRNRQATLVGVLAAGAVAGVLFWAVDFGLLGVDRGPLAFGGALLLGVLTGLVTWASLRSRQRAFTAEVRRSEAPPALDDEARRFAGELRRGGAADGPKPTEGAPDALPDGGTDVATIAARVERIQRQNLLATVVGAAAGLLAVAAVVAGVEVVNSFVRRAIELSLYDLIIVIAAGFGVGMLVSRRLRSAEDPLAEPEAAGAIAESTPDAFERSLGTTGRLSVRRAADLVGGLTGFEGALRFDVLDGGGAHLCTAAERGRPLVRWLLGARRPLEIAIVDVDRQVARLTRPLALFGGLAEVRDADGERLGAVRSALGRRWLVEGPDGRYEIRGVFLRGRHHRVLRDGAEVGRVVRARRSWFASSLDDSQSLTVELPKGSSVADRTLLLATALVLAS